MYIDPDKYRRDFYDQLLGHRVLLLSSYDVDSVCCVKILQYLLRMDENPYIIVSVEGVDDLRQKFKEYRPIKRVVLINCGGTLDLMDLFDNPTDVIIFVIDSHRPTHILNIYNESEQIRIVQEVVVEEEIPDFDDIFRPEEILMDSDDSDEDEHDMSIDVEDGEDSGHPAVDRRVRAAERRAKNAQQRKEYREWQLQRDKLLFNYTKHNYYGTPAALVALEVAWSKSIGDSDIVWWAIVGLTEYFILHRMDSQTYTLLASQLQNHVSRITHETAPTLAVLKITFEQDLYLYLYRHWNVYASIRHTPNWRCKFRLWSSKGTQRLHAYLAEIGFPLKEVKQSFDSMNLRYRRNLKAILNKRADKYDLVDDMSFGSFVAQYLYAYKFSALDHCLSVMSLLEEPGEKSAATRFLNALQSLCKTKINMVMDGIGISKQIITGMISQVQIFLDLKQIIVTNDLLYAVIQYGTLDEKYFRNPCSLVLLANHALQAFISSSPRGKMTHQLPLVVIAPRTIDTHHVVGIPPLATDLNQNLFGKAFESIAKKMPNSMSMDLFESNICIIRSSEIEKFLEQLMELLA